MEEERRDRKKRSEQFRDIAAPDIQGPEPAPLELKKEESKDTSKAEGGKEDK